jgi:hypothetical protein
VASCDQLRAQAVSDRALDPVFVLADDGLHVFENLDVLGGWIEGIDVENRVYEAIYMLDGRVVTATAKGNDAQLTVTKTIDEAGLRDLVRRYADRFESDPEGSRAVAVEWLQAEWNARWPTRPRWLARRLHGERLVLWPALSWRPGNHGRASAPACSARAR